jgi:hypothetical protein
MCISSFYIWKILKVLVKILTCNTLISVGSCFLLCVLTICVFTISSCVWVHNGVEILRGPCLCYHVVHLSSCVGYCLPPSPPPLFIYVFLLFSYYPAHQDRWTTWQQGQGPLKISTPLQTQTQLDRENTYITNRHNKKQ